ncbi:MAG: DUF6165 family protein [Desulfosarcinaceae bacterium]
MKIEVSNGEIVDKFTILSIKLEMIQERSKLENIRTEYQLLKKALDALKITEADLDLKALCEVNRTLWDIEDRIRSKEAAGQFDREFIELARSVYMNNDKRAALKQRINRKTQSSLCEEKSYVNYRKEESE